MPPLRVGILGVAGISSKTAIAISSPDSECQVSAVASRSVEKAKNFASKYLSQQDVQIFGDYEKLIQSDVDALYIPLPLAVKKSWVIKSLQAGKHVVIEKPAALSAADYQEMLKIAYTQQKFLLDGTMFPHHPRTQKILSSLSDIGKVDRIQISFTFLADQEFLDGSNIRSRRDGDPQGCIGDLGWYCVRYALMVYRVLGSKVKSAQVVDFELNKHGVPIDATCVVRFENNKVLWFHCGFKTPLRQLFEICGSKKSITVDDLILPVAQSAVCYTLRSSSLTQNNLLTIHETETVMVKDGPVHEVLLWKSFRRIAQSLDQNAARENSSSSSDTWAGDASLVKEANEWASISVSNQVVIDALMESLEKGCVAVTL